MKVKVNGELKELKAENISTVAENWSEYQMEGGQTIRAKFVLTHVFDTGLLDADGNKVYQFSGQPIFVVLD